MEILTPAWATGANQQQAELRVPTFRGQLRFWLRMLFPGQRLDEEIFGQTDAFGARASCVALSLPSWRARLAVQNLEDYTGKKGDDALSEPEAYFLWPLRPTKDSQQKRGVLYQPSKESSASFVLELSWLPPALSRRMALNAFLLQAIKAFSLLGAFGSRSTRGYGSVWPLGQDFATAATFARELQFLPDSISVRLLPAAAGSGRQALAEAARWFRRTRLGTSRFTGTPLKWGQNDHDVALNPQPDLILYRPALGLPLAQNYRNGPKLQTKYRWCDSDSGRETWNDRYPSPVRFKIVRIAKEYRVVLVLLRDQLLPEATRLRIEERGRSAREVRLSHELFNEIANVGEAIH
ncbi:MAG: hypothetical protein M1608_12310 [Candidatus Omnitrophica bacterium]|nr:hypothetical protein [Candidatus Omnitrophota bacterium]